MYVRGLTSGWKSPSLLKDSEGILSHIYKNCKHAEGKLIQKNTYKTKKKYQNRREKNQHVLSDLCVLLRRKKILKQYVRKIHSQ